MQLVSIPEGFMIRFSPAESNVFGVFALITIGFGGRGRASVKPSKVFQNCFCTFYVLTCTNKKSMAVRPLSNLKIHAICSPSNLILVYTRYNTGLEIRPIMEFKRRKKEKI